MAENRNPNSRRRQERATKRREGSRRKDGEIKVLTLDLGTGAWIVREIVSAKPGGRKLARKRAAVWRAGWSTVKLDPPEKIPEPRANNTIPKGAICWHASPYVETEYVPCGKPAVAIVDDHGDRRYMCERCADDWVQDRGARITAEVCYRCHQPAGAVPPRYREYRPAGPEPFERHGIAKFHPFCWRARMDEKYCWHDGEYTVNPGNS